MIVRSAARMVVSGPFTWNCADPRVILSTTTPLPAPYAPRSIDSAVRLAAKDTEAQRNRPRLYGRASVPALACSGCKWAGTEARPYVPLACAEARRNFDG